MKTNNQNSSGQGDNQPWMSPQWLYRSIMKHLEPDLVISKEVREQKYANETPQQRKERLERYAVSFVLFDRVLDTFSDELIHQVREYRTAEEEHARSADATKAEQELEQYFQDESK